MSLQNIKVAQAYESATNPRGKDFEGPAFDDLVASVKEKGVLVPVIVRPLKKGDKQFEIVAGNRRFRAAKLSGLEEIPARVEEMSDEQAREVQIIENLQREDVHPLDEGEAYRQLIEKSGFEISVIAAKVGKHESYIRQRLFITNITDKVKTALRAEKIAIGHALLIARLEEAQQLKALKYCLDRYNTPSVEDFKEWIEENIYNDLKKMSWLNDKNLIEIMGSCNDCATMKRNSLFPDKEVPKNCINPDCLEKKKKAYVDMKMNQEKLIKVSTDYGDAKKGVVEKSKYTTLSTKKDDHCESTKRAIVVEGDNFGSILHICMDDKCKKHKSYQSSYSLSPAEKEKRKKAIAKETAKKDKEDKALMVTLEKIEWPMTGVELEVLYELTMAKYGTDQLRPIAKRHQWEPVKVQEKSHMDKDKVRNVTSWEKTVRQNIANMTDDQKLRFIIEVMLEGTWSEPRNKILKLIEKGV